MWATLRAGGRVNGASPAYTAEEMAHALGTASTKFLFTLPASLDVALEAAAQAGLPSSRIFLLEGRRAGFLTILDLIAAGSSQTPSPAYRIPIGSTNQDICGYLNFSSGTTGLPKAVMLSHHNIIAQCHQLAQLQVVTPGEPYRMLAVTPLFHITGLVRSCHYPVHLNGECIMLPAFHLPTMCRTIIAHRIEELILVPPILIRLVQDPAAAEYHPQLRQIVKRFSSGSAPTSPEIIRALERMFPDTGFRQGYGATESTACISCHPPSHYDYRYAHTGGLACANTRVKVLSISSIDSDDEQQQKHPRRELGLGETGEICAQGPQIAMGYLANPRATAETFQDGWFHTGDVGYVDAEGLLHISDRLKEMIKVKGQQVAPAELEDCLLGHAAVADCAVLGVPDTYAGERPKAFVVLQPGVEASEEKGKELMGFVRGRKVRWKGLVEVEFVDGIPKSATGKLLRRVLKTREREEGREKGLIVRENESQQYRARL